MLLVAAAALLVSADPGAVDASPQCDRFIDENRFIMNPENRDRIPEEELGDVETCLKLWASRVIIRRDDGVSEEEATVLGEMLSACAPPTYSAALDCLDRHIPEAAKTALLEEGGVIESHLGLGMFLRNNWGLWDASSQLHRSMRELGFTHPDDMSGAILRGFAARERGETFVPSPPDPAEFQAEWDRLVQEGRAGSIVCPERPEPKTAEEARAQIEACLDFISKSLESGQN